MPGFPAHRAAQHALVERALSDGLLLRSACSEDLPWLQELYAQLRASELAPLGWPQAMLAAFLQSQFTAQHHHFLQAYPQVDWWIVQKRDARGTCHNVGRLYLHQTAQALTVVELGLLPEWQSQGIGRLLLAHVLALATQAACPVQLHVLQGNDRALQLYQRLGFSIQEDIGSHWRMEWQPPVSA